jgi:DNA-binding transcriptional ArsR family regulator
VSAPMTGRAERSRRVTHREPAEQGALVELSPAQVDQIVRAVSGGGTMSLLFSGLADVRAMLGAGPGQLDNRRLSRSLLAGLLMLASFPSDGSYMGIAELARMLDMSPSTTHRYVTTLLAVGLLERDPRTRQYRLADAS